ncbi:nuclear transport factor 2 family protein [Streptomyces sp. NPDC052301]|uniref:nuclear transport factor 2 family protein n=1 Tax=Streptomyces sp. NPDC052301 TaxID=3365687 RepID=UPI0037CEA01D
MNGSPASVVEAAFRHYRSQDREAALPLYADDFTFTSPQDDHIGKEAFFARCFPTAHRFTDQRILHLVAADEEVVFVQYEYGLSGGEGYRNVEAITVRDGLIREVRVFFGGTV